MACSPDGISAVDLEIVPGGPTSQIDVNVMPSNHPWNMQATEGQFVLAAVKIKTSVAYTSVERAAGRASLDLNICKIGHARFREYVPDAHIGQLLHQLLVLKFIRLYEGASFSPDRLHSRPEGARYLLTLVTACSDRDTHTLSNFS
jgi:hypothetical protein